MFKFRLVLGWILVFWGLIFIFSPLYFSYEIFTGKKEPPLVFKFEDYSKNKKDINLQNTQNFQIQQLQNLIKEEIKNLIPQQNISKAFNLTSLIIFSWLLVYAGSQVASIGIKLLNKN